MITKIDTQRKRHNDDFLYFNFFFVLPFCLLFLCSRILSVVLPLIMIPLLSHRANSASLSGCWRHAAASASRQKDRDETANMSQNVSPVLSFKEMSVARG